MTLHARILRALGKRLLLHVKHLCTLETNYRVFHRDTAMNKVLYEISNKRLGLTTIVDDNDHLLGILLMVIYAVLFDKQQGFDVNLVVSTWSSRARCTISPEARAVEAFERMNEKEN